MSLLILILFASLIGLTYTYGGFLLLLVGLVFLRRKLMPWRFPFSEDNQQQHGEGGSLPGLTVYFSAYNEERDVKDKFSDILAQDYPREKLQLILVSDGSTDGTVAAAREVVRENPLADILIEVFPTNRGRAAAQNRVAEIARHEVLLATDAETRFDRDILIKLGRALTDPTVGVAGGRVIYGRSETYIAKSIGVYRGMEERIRKCEQDLGAMVKVDGPCVAYRKSIWTPIEDFEDIDQVIILLAKKKGYRSVMVADAVCLDSANASIKQEIKARRRMTRKALLSTNNRWKFSHILMYPFFSFVLYSHKFIRFFSPVFLLLLAAAVLLLALSHGVLVHFVSFAALMVLFAWMNKRIFGLQYVSTITERSVSFLVANLGFALGLIDWLKGNKVGTYTPIRQIAHNGHHPKPK